MNLIIGITSNILVRSLQDISNKVKHGINQAAWTEAWNTLIKRLILVIFPTQHTSTNWCSHWIVYLILYSIFNEWAVHHAQFSFPNQWSLSSLDLFRAQFMSLTPHFTSGDVTSTAVSTAATKISKRTALWQQKKIILDSSRTQRTAFSAGTWSTNTKR